MFTLRFATVRFRPDITLTLRNSVDGWEHDIAGNYQDDAWHFELDEKRYPDGAAFKFLLERAWMVGENLFFPARAPGEDFLVEDAAVEFPPLGEVLTENGNFQQRFFAPNPDETHVYDVIVIGSGIGGGIVADQLADLGADVLVLEAGSALFTTHTANLPRQYQLGQFEKHLWALFDEYKIKNYRDADGSAYQGAQAFNLGGRSVFWGAFIPRMTWWELESWPTEVRWALEETGYTHAEDLMYWPLPPGAFQPQVKSWLNVHFADYDHFDAPIAVRQVNTERGTLAPGVFSTADLLTEGRISVDPQGLGKCTINLNHAVTGLQTDAAGQVTAVHSYDLIASRPRQYQGRFVVLAAGTVESAKIAQASALANPAGLIGKGITDHPVLFTHFSIPPGKTWHRPDASSKTLSRHKNANASAHPYNVLLELGADLNHGRYLDQDTLRLHRQLKGDAMLCEIVFLFNSKLVEDNWLLHEGPSYVKPLIQMKKSAAADPFLAEIGQLKDRIIQDLQGEPITGGNLELAWGALGGVAHEVGTLRMGLPGQGVVDPNLKFTGHDNLYVCDLSVFPTSPAANPSLTLAALALRLAQHLRGRL
jgi:choline dehydrogenase-like flavoprotein